MSNGFFRHDRSSTFESLVNSYRCQTLKGTGRAVVRLRALLIRIGVKRVMNYNENVSRLRALLIRIGVKRIIAGNINNVVFETNAINAERVY